jgi:hypothetical protein
MPGYRAWYRHITLSMLAYAFLAVSARALRPARLEPPAASGAPGGEPAKRGRRGRRAGLRPVQDI